MEMYSKVYFLLAICFLQQINSNAFLEEVLLNFVGGVFGFTDCMTAFQLVKSIKILCENRDNATLWQQCIDCHAPITEKFMRESPEAQCPIPKTVENPTDTRFSFQKVFFNICGFVEGNLPEKAKGFSCLIRGQKSRNIMSHSKEVGEVRRIWGAQVPCEIGKCILRMGLNL